MEAGKVLVAIRDSSLARVLSLWLADALPGHLVVRGLTVDAAPGDAVLVTPADCEPGEVAELVAHGSRAVVLTPVSRPTERERYAAAGASYVVMSIENNSALVSAVLGEPPAQSVAPDLRAASSQRVSPNCSA